MENTILKTQIKTEVYNSLLKSIFSGIINSYNVNGVQLSPNIIVERYKDTLSPLYLEVLIELLSEVNYFKTENV